MRISKIARILYVIVINALFIGCMSAHEHYQQTHGPKERQLTVGTVQKEIRKGMSAAEVTETLGSPNIVTTDDKRREVWIYDKISTDASYSKDSGGGGLILVFGYGKSAGAKSTNQRTLTVIIKFDEQKKVRDFAYNYTQF